MKGIKSLVNKVLLELAKIIYPVHVWALPERICIDASTICNLKCVTCQTGQNKNKLSKGFLKFKDFKKFIDKYHIYLKQLLLSNWGEIFLNPEIFKIIKYAKKHNIKVIGDSNLNFLNEKMADELVKSQMDKLTIALDGATNKTYIKHRVGGNFNKVISNIKLINKAKAKHKTPYPRLVWQYILFDHNKQEINKAKKLAKKLNMEFYIRENLSPIFSNIQDRDKTEIKENIRKPNGFCHQLWEYPFINYNGNLLGCCVTMQENGCGNIFKEGFLKAYNNKRIKSMRKAIIKGQNSDNSFCFRCSPTTSIHKIRSSNLKAAIDRNIGKIGIIIRKISPLLHTQLKKIK